ncbi:MAG: hypothetical protein IKU40_03105, partial [Clostridia bacterium]|nr:hypothetical protein [Clostridia bacterium]
MRLFIAFLLLLTSFLALGISADEAVPEETTESADISSDDASAAEDEPVFTVPASRLFTMVSEPDYGVFDESGFPALSDESAVRWIDRPERLPLYAEAMYRWLEREAHSGGALSDVTLGDRIIHADGSEAFVHTIPLTYEFSFRLPDDLPPASRQSYITLMKDRLISYIAAEVFDNAVRPLVTAENAFDRDHPEVFWMTGACSWNTRCTVTSVTVKENTVYVTCRQRIFYYLSSSKFDIRAESYRDPAIIAEAEQERDRAADEIIASIPEGADTEGILRHFNRTLTMINGYNSSDDLYSVGSDPRECISALTGRYGEKGPVCEGYARAFKVLCDRVSIPCVLADGVGTNKPESDPVLHIWNLVYPGDGFWYAVDVTWNDPVINGKSDLVSGYESEKYFLIGRLDERNDLKFENSHALRNQVMDPGVCFVNG